MSDSDSESDYDAQEIVSDGQEGVAEEGVVDYTRGAVIGGSATALGIALVEILLGIPGTFLAPVRAFADGMATFIGGTLGAPPRITDAAATASARSFLEGTGALLGPFAFPLGVVVVVAGMLVFLWFIGRISVSPVQALARRRN